jgi:hypothetical protein
MWFKKLIALIRYKFILKKFSNVSAVKPERKFCEKLFNELNVDLFIFYKNANGSMVQLETYFPNIDQYTKKIAEIIQQLRQEKAITPEWYDRGEGNISLDRFLVSEDGYYFSNLSYELVRFKQNVLTLCQLMEKSDTETYGLYEHNLRMLTKLFINLRNIAMVMINVSLTR